MKVDTVLSPVTFEELVEMADDAGVKLEITGGIPTWEAFPGPQHQKAVLRALLNIEASEKSDCGCFQLPDTYIKFPDGSLKRPDIAIFLKSRLIRMRRLKKSLRLSWKFYARIMKRKIRRSARHFI